MVSSILIFISKKSLSGRYDTYDLVILPGSCPSIVTMPLLGLVSPTISFIKVVFPLPFGPSKPTIFPLSMLRLIFLSTCFAP